MRRAARKRNKLIAWLLLALCVVVAPTCWAQITVLSTGTPQQRQSSSGAPPQQHLHQQRGGPNGVAYGGRKIPTTTSSSTTPTIPASTTTGSSMRKTSGTSSSSSSSSTTTPSQTLASQRFARRADDAVDASAAAVARMRTRLLGQYQLGAATVLAAALGVPLLFVGCSSSHTIWPALPEDTPLRHKLKSVYQVLSVASLVHELLAILYATVAAHKLVVLLASGDDGDDDVRRRRTKKIEAVDRRMDMDPADGWCYSCGCALEWVACRLHFWCGLLGVVGMVAIRGYTLFPPPLHHVAAGLGGAALLAVIAAVNNSSSSSSHEVVAAGTMDRRDRRGGENLVSLGLRYLWLLVQNVWHTRGVVALAALLLGLASLGGAGYYLCLPETTYPRGML